jgi:hypothetical protein
MVQEVLLLASSEGDGDAAVECCGGVMFYLTFWSHLSYVRPQNASQRTQMEA